METDQPQTRIGKPPPGRKIKSGLVLPILFIAALPLLFHLLVSAYFSNERLAPLVDQALERYLPRRVVWQEMRFNPYTGLSFNGFQIGEHPDFGKGFFLSCQRLNLSLRFSDLIRGKIRIKKISLNDPLITVRQDSQGRLNLHDIAAEIKKAAAPGTVPESRNDPEGMSFDLEEILIKNGLALVDLRSVGLSRRIRDLSLKACRRSSGPSFDWVLHLTVGNIPARGEGVFNPAPYTGTAHLQAREVNTRSLIRFLPQNSGFDLPEGKVSVDLDLSFKESGLIELQGNLKAARASLVLHRPNRILKDIQAELDLDLKYDPQDRRLALETAFLFQDQNQARLTGWIKPDGYDLSGSIILEDSTLLNRCGLLYRPVLSGAAELEVHLVPDKKDKTVLLDGRLKTRQLNLNTDSVPLGPFNLDADFRASYQHRKNRLLISSTGLSLPGAHAALSGSIGPKGLNLELGGLKLDLSIWRTLLSSLAIPVENGQVLADLSLGGDLSRPEEWKLGGQAELKGVALRFNWLADALVLGGPLEFKGRKVITSKLAGKLGPANITLKGEADLFSSPAKAELDLEIDRLDLRRVSALNREEGPDKEAGLDLPAGWSSGLFLQGQMKIGTLSHLGHSLERVRIKYHLDRRRLLLAPFKAKIKPQGLLTLNLTLDLSEVRTGYQGQLSLSKAGTEELTGFLGLDQSRFPKGTLDMTAAFGGKGLDLQDLRSNLTAQLTAEINNGRFPDNPVFNSLSRFLGLEYLEDCQFRTWKGGLELTKGRSDIRGSILDREYSFDYSGQLDLGGRIELTVRLGLDPMAVSDPIANRVIEDAPQDGQGLYIMPLLIRGRGAATGVVIDEERLQKIRDELQPQRSEGP